MKHLICSISLLLLTHLSHSQTKVEQAQNFLKTNNIKLNQVKPPHGFKVYYNCDSVLFMRGNFGDTIKFLIASSELPQEISDFKKSTKKQNFGITSFAKKILPDGRIVLASYGAKDFINRNDSLFELIDTAKLSSPEMIKIATHFQSNDLSNQSATLKAFDSIFNYLKENSYRIPKLIFTKSSFKNVGDKITFDKSQNFEGDSILLEKKWIENGKMCYVIRITNRSEFGSGISYPYAFNDSMKFIWWEGCNKRE